MTVRWFLPLIVCVSLLADPASLKETDINKVMQEIFSQHVDKKEMNEVLLKSAFKTYIEQFDPDKTYLIQSEVNPYLNMDNPRLETLLKRYKAGDYTAFKELNKVFQKSIARARENRTQDQLNLLVSRVINEGYMPRVGSDFAVDLKELNTRQEAEFAQFVQQYIHRFGKAAAVSRSQDIVKKYVAESVEHENPYLYLNLEGNPIAKEEEENLFSLHVLKALASTLDSHTKIYNPKEAYDMRVRLEKGFKGVGIILEEKGNDVVISTIIQDSPAAKNGLLQPGDKLLEINGENVQGLDFDEVLDRVRKPSASDLTITINRESQKIIRVTLKKESIVLDQNRVKIFTEKYGNGIIGVIRLDSFYQGDQGLSAEKDVRQAIAELDKQNLRGLVLDLRENNGGFLTQAVRIAGLFISNGIVVISKYSSGEEKFYRDMDGRQAYKGPLIILVSRETASAAEIVAQALQDYGVALIVGDDHTYGKGTIQSQTVTDKNNSTSYFKVTVGKYYTVSGKTPQVQGVISDVIIPGPLADQQIGEEYLDYTLKQDTIPPAYSDKLADVDPHLRDWYMKYYVPTLQIREREWRSLVPELKKNSEYRLEHNKDYQLLLKDEKGEPVNEPLPDVELSDMQRAEALNVLKDMIYFETKSKRQMVESN